jgi:hypothetical protein
MRGYFLAAGAGLACALILAPSAAPAAAAPEAVVAELGAAFTARAAYAVKVLSSDYKTRAVLRVERRAEGGGPPSSGGTP